MYESFDQGDTIHDVGIGEGGNQSVAQNAIAYGGRQGGVDNPDVTYVGTQSALWLRSSPAGAFVAVNGAPDGVVMDPNDWAHAFVFYSGGGVEETTNAGASWTNRTGNLPTLAGTRFRSVAYVAAVPDDIVFVGTGRGVYVAFASNFSSWQLLGSGLPNAPVFDLAYDPYDDVLVAGTLGRGAWKLSNIGGSPPPPTTTTTSTTTTTTTTTTTLPSCPPSPSTCQRAAPQGSVLVLKHGTPDKNRLSWKWKSSLAVSQSDFGFPDFDTSYVLCIYDSGGLRLHAGVAAGGFCGTKPCWIGTSTGFKYGNKALTPDGVLKMSLAAGGPGKGKLGVKGKGANLDMPGLPLSNSVSVQLLRGGTSTCWEATYTAPSRNDMFQFKAKSG